MTKALILVSNEAFEMLQLGIRVDTSLRKLSVFAMEQQYEYSRYFQILTKVTDAIFAYRQFIDTLFTYFQGGLLYNKEKSDFSPHFFKGILKYLRENGKLHIVKISTSPAGEIFALTKSTDVIARICVEFGWNDVQKAIFLKQEIAANIKTFKKTADECYSEYCRVRQLVETHQKRKKFKYELVGKTYQSGQYNS